MSSNKANESKNESSSNRTKVPENSNVNMSETIKELFTNPTTGGFKVPEPIYQEMDSNNKKAVDVWEKEGQSAAIKHMFTDQETGRTLSYSEMRSRYG